MISVYPTPHLEKISHALTIFSFSLTRILQSLTFTPSTDVDGEVCFAKDDEVWPAQILDV